ncbi:hypothetical protein L6452_00588 [Arctium lappa]|uniref:Uncharacterized protein n=1 Tax=Arctium lappa TaxID=4217 RepID=A0ACB9FDX0_ARCLA|nr:hypothetical protein L6452_00588 [Arctium lappa]
MHCISKKTTGWSEFSSTIAYALVCLATAKKYNFSQMIFNDLVSNLGNKKSFYMYPRFVQAVITHELSDIPQPVGVYVPKPPKGKVFSNMRRSAGDSEGVDTPLFSTMMVVSQTTEGMAAGETTGVSPRPKEVLSEEEEEYMGDEAATTPASTEEESGNIHKTSPMATSIEQSFEGGNTPGEGEDRYDYDELMETMGNINQDVINQGKEIEDMKLVILSQQVQITKLKKLVMKLVHKKKKRHFVLRRRISENDAPKKGEINMEEATKEGELDRNKFDVEGEQKEETERELVQKETQQAAETVTTAENKQAAETVKEVLTDLEIAETLLKAKSDTPKVTSKTKGVIIKEQGEEIKKDNSKKEMNKDKGKAKMIESDQPVKRQRLVESDEALARKIQEDIEKEERVQVEKDREMAKSR